MTLRWHSIVYVLTVMVPWLYVRRAEGLATLMTLAVVCPLDLGLTVLSTTRAIFLDDLI